MFFTSEEIINLIVTFLWVPIVVSYFSVFLTYRSKNGKLISYIVWIIFWLLDGSFIQDRISSILWRAVYTIVVCTVIGLILYHNKLRTVLLVSASFYCITAIAESVVVFILLFLQVRIDEYELSAWIISKLIIVMIIQAIRIKHKNKMDGEVTITYWIMSVLIPIGSIIIIYIITELTLQLINIKHSITASFALFIVLIMNIFIFGVYDKLQKEAAIRQNNIMYEQQAKMYKLQSEEREAVWLESRKLQHDFKQHLVCLKGYNQEQHYNEMDEYLSQIIDEYTINYWKNKSGNMIIDSLLGYKMKKAENDKITLHTEFQVSNQMPFEEADLCIIVGNAFDNAIEAVKKIEEEKRTINLKMKFDKNVLSIAITNPYIGEIQSDPGGKLLTIKADKKYHGIGIGSMEKAIKRYEGVMKIQKEDNLFKLMIVMYGKEGLYVN